MPDEITTASPSPIAPDDSDPHSAAEAERVASEPEVEVKPEELAGASEAADPSTEEDPAGEGAEGTSGTSGASLDQAVATEAEGAVDPTLTGGTEGVSGASTGSLESDTAPSPATSSESDSTGSLGSSGTSAPLDDATPSAPSGEESADAPGPGLSEPTSTDGTDGASGASAPPADEKPAEEAESSLGKDSPYGGLHDVAKPLEARLGLEVIEDLEDAAALLFHIREALNEANLDGLDPELSALTSNLRNQGAAILAALEGIFKRIA